MKNALATFKLNVFNLHVRRGISTRSLIFGEKAIRTQTHGRTS